VVGTSPCPPSSAAASGACAREGLVCEYGDDLRPACRDRATCTGGSWIVATPLCTLIPPATGGCPNTREEAQGKPCAPGDALCGYGGLVCTCAACAPGGPVGCDVTSGPTTWYCEAPNPDPQGPPARPRLGATCATDGVACIYSCGFEGGRTCRGGTWVPSDGSMCPRSSRVVKRDIRYLDAAGIDALAREVALLKLATWEYTDPVLAGRRHLGFIIEDRPGIPAVAPGGATVDLYGYASMRAAALQSQQRELEELKRELAAVRAELADARASRPQHRAVVKGKRARAPAPSPRR
jgi:hypothetical protein